MATRVLSSSRPRCRAFTMIELLVAITVSVILLSILAFVFKISTAATRTASAKISITERMRLLNIRLRQEVGAMQDEPRIVAVSANQRTYQINKNDTSAIGSSLTFTCNTNEDGYATKTDVRYEYLKGPAGKPEKGVLVRRRSYNGRFKVDSTTLQLSLDNNKNPIPNTGTVGKTGGWGAGLDNFYEANITDPDKVSPSTIVMTNVRSCTFTVFDPPGNTTDKDVRSQLNPRTLPSAVKLDIKFGTDNAGSLDMYEQAVFVYPVYGGL